MNAGAQPTFYFHFNPGHSTVHGKPPPTFKEGFSEANLDSSKACLVI